MKKYLGLIAALLVALVVIAFSIFTRKQAVPDPVAGASFSAPGFNQWNTSVMNTTSTLGSFMQIVLPRNNSRIYALIQNTSNSDIFIYPSNFADHAAAEKQGFAVGASKGIRVTANGGAYEIVPENLFQGDIWVASTTATGSLILTTENATST